jgi:hypothetical protein
MTPKFILPAGYESRPMQLVLTRSTNGKSWQFMGWHQGYAVPARNPAGELLCRGETFATKAEAAIMARALDLPAYGIWSGAKRCYDIPYNVPRFIAHARDHAENAA